MKFSITKPRKLSSGKRVPYYGVRLTLESTYEEQAARQLYPTLGRAPKGRAGKADTETWLHGIQKAIEHRAHLLSMGMPVQDTTAFSERVKEFIEWGKVQGGKRRMAWAPSHAEHIGEYLAQWAQAMELHSLSDIRQAPFDREIVKLSRTFAPNTINHRARALTALCSWAVRQGYLPLSPVRFRALDKTPVQERGAFTLDELKILFAAVPAARSLLYRAAYYLRLRRAELASLRVSSVQWSDGFIRLDYKDAKDRKTALIPVPGKLLSDLWAAAAGKGDGDPLLDFSMKHAARVLHRDMERLGIPVDMSGRRRDFHSLGASTATSMDRRGIAPALASKTMRHKSWAQTENYIKLETEQVRVVTQGLEDEIEHTDNTQEARMRNEPITTGVSAHSGSGPSPSAITPLGSAGPRKTVKFRQFSRDKVKAPAVTWEKARKILAHCEHTIRVGEHATLEAFLALTPKQRAELIAGRKQGAA